MAGTFKFELVTPERMLIPAMSDDPKHVATAEAEMAVVPGTDGQFTVMAGHAPLISTLRPGIVEVKLTNGMRRVFVRGGFVEVEADRLTIIAQSCVDIDAKDRESIATEIRVAEADLEVAKTDDERTNAQSAIEQLRSLTA